ncbi:MAG: hypothetical protein ACKKMW_02455 [Candidatus Nealsonbacteria bacterium]
MKIRRRLKNIKWEVKEIIRRRIKGQYRAGEILNLTFKKIKKRYGEQEIILPHYALSLIADDSDYHRTRQGFMRYDSVVLISLGDKFWALGKGRSWGSYPARPYDNDILVLGLDNSQKDESTQKIAEKMIDWIRWSHGFSNSIIAAKNSGSLFVGSNWAEIMTALLESKLPDFIKKGLKTYEGYVTLEVDGIMPAIKSSVKYKKKLAKFLSQTIIQVLSDPSKYK